MENIKQMTITEVADLIISEANKRVALEPKAPSSWMRQQKRVWSSSGKDAEEKR